MPRKYKVGLVGHMPNQKNIGETNVMFVNGVYRCVMPDGYRPPPGYNWDRGVRSVGHTRMYTATKKKDEETP
jgi:hypothetical protein